MIEITIYGHAEPAGSKTKTQYGVRDSNPRSKVWKEEVRREAARILASDVNSKLLDGPLRVRFTFYRPRPKGHYGTKGDLNAAGRRATHPTTKPDTTKLIRGVEDALTGIVWRDDSQIVQQAGAKKWGEPERVHIQIELLAVPS